ncbi:MAG: hypothetical protein RL459_414 [Pseudomonadota bacterium]|jgi:putative ubiquitin-RnfH superfamily antitoxin RatB of RatAB toxin-antitoxin module
MIHISLVWSPESRQVIELALPLKSGTTVAEALSRSEVIELLVNTDPTSLEVGVWGRRVERQQVLQDGDRLEIYRPLKVDPKVARRERFARQGAKTTGLFAKRRPGAKAGY